MADDPQDHTPDGTDDGRADAEASRSGGGLGRFASRFRRSHEAPPADVEPADTTTHASDASEAGDVSVGPQTDTPVLLNRPDVDWSARQPSNAPPIEAADPEAPEQALSPVGSEVVPTDEPVSASPEEPDEPEEAAAPPTAEDITAPATPPAVPSVPVAREAPLPTPAPMDFDEATEPLPPEVAAGPRTRPAGISAHLAVLTGVATAVIVAFLLIEPSPRWLLLLGAAAVVFGLDGTLRQTWRAPFSLGQETAPFLFAPALYMLAVPVLIEHNVSGELALLVGLGAGLGFGGLAWAEVASVRPQAAEYEQARIVVTANTYLAGFAIFSLSYVFEIGLPAAIIATAIAASMLATRWKHWGSRWSSGSSSASSAGSSTTRRWTPTSPASRCCWCSTSPPGSSTATWSER